MEKKDSNKEERFSEFRLRMNALAEYLGYSWRSFSKEIGRSDNWFKNINVAISTSDLGEILLRFPNVNYRWIIFGEGDMLLTGEQLKPADRLKHDDTGPLLDYLKQENAQLREEVYELNREIGRLQANLDKVKKNALPDEDVGCAAVGG